MATSAEVGTQGDTSEEVKALDDYSFESINLEKVKKDMAKPALGSVDWAYALLVILLSAIGLIMMFSASYPWAARWTDTPSFFVSRQGVFMLLGIIVMLLISRFDYRKFAKFSLLSLVVSVVLLILVLFIGSDEMGAVRWLNFGLFNVQPSEVAKIAVLLMFASMISTRPDWFSNTKFIPSMKGLAPYLLVLALIIVPMALQPHFSGIVLIMAIGGTMIFMGGFALRWMLLAGGAMVGVVTLLITSTDYAARRLALWRDPWLEPIDGGYQAIQSLFAIGSGGWLGLGLGQSRQKYYYLPEPHNDFVFAIVVEELGFLGALLILFVFAMLIIRGYQISLNTKDTFGKLLVAGVTTRLAVQVFLNVAVVTNLIPVTGISMPFFSYGGSSLLIQMVEMGIVLAVSRQRRVS